MTIFSWVLFGLNIVTIVINYVIIRSLFDDANVHWEKGVKLMTIIISVILGWHGLLVLCLLAAMMSFGKDLSSVREWYNKRAKW